MVRVAQKAFAQIGRLATPSPEVLGGATETKDKDFFREVYIYIGNDLWAMALAMNARINATCPTDQLMVPFHKEDLNVMPMPSL